MVSEETGQISYINNGAFILFDDTNDLIEIITVFSSRVYGLRSYKEKIIVEKQDILNKNK